TTKEFVWPFPKAGSLSFACRLPGHHQAGMVGEFALR
ncbi:plastocyanin, partial [Arthrobacter stackebrandtii]